MNNEHVSSKLSHGGLLPLYFVIVVCLDNDYLNLSSLISQVDNYSHLFGFIFGFLLSFTVLPYVSFGEFDRKRKITTILICLLCTIGKFGHGRMARGCHGLPKVSLGPTMPYPSTPCGQPAAVFYHP
jgi:hypothetical protein